MVQLDASGRLDTSMMPTGIGADSVAVLVGTSVSAGDFVNLYDNTGAEVRPADNTVPYPAVGFVKDSVTANASNTVNVYFEGINTNLTGLTPGATYFLSTTGDIDTYANITKASGDVVQKVGTALSATSLSFEYTNPVTLV
jgi:hypothetical protein